MENLAADIPAIAPASTDPQTVILWVIGTLVVAIALSLKYIVDQQGKAESRCREENAAANKKADSANEKVETILKDTLGHYGDAMSRMTRTLDRTNDIQDRSNEVLEQSTKVFQKFIETDRYEKKHL
jgi:hypothetical protein